MNTLSKILTVLVLILGVSLCLTIKHLSVVKAQVATLNETVQTLEKEKKKASDLRISFNSTMNEAQAKSEQLDRTYSDIQYRMEDLKCKQKVSSNEIKPPSLTSTLDAAKRLLDESACAVNGDCKPPKGPSKAL